MGSKTQPGMFFFRMNKGGLSIGLHSLPSILSKSSSGTAFFKGRLFILELFFHFVHFLGDFFVPASLLFCFCF